VPIHREQFLLDEALERALHEFIARFDVVEDVLAQDEKTAIQHNSLLDRASIRVAIPSGVASDGMETVPAVDTRKRRDHTLRMEIRDHFVEWQVRKAVRIVGKERRFPAQVFFHLQQTLTDVGVQTGVDEVIRQSWISVECNSILRPPSDRVKSFDMHSL